MTMDLKVQVSKLQGEALETKNQLALIDQLQAQVSKLQGEVADNKKEFVLVKKEVLVLSEMKEDECLSEMAAPTLLTSPRRGLRLGQMFRKGEDCASRSNSPSKKDLDTLQAPSDHSQSRSNSPDRVSSARRGRIEARLRGCRLGQIFSSAARSLSPKRNNTHNLEDIHPSLYDSPSRSISPEKNHSPSRRIEARLAPKLLGNVTCFVDGQIQNLELRMASMEQWQQGAFANWRQATVPVGVVEGMCASDLQMLTGVNVVTSNQASMLSHHLLSPSAKSGCDLSSCTTTDTQVHAGSDCKGLSKKDSAGSCQGRGRSSWKQFFRRSKASC